MILKLDHIAYRTALISIALILAACGGDEKTTANAAVTEGATTNASDTIKKTFDRTEENTHGKGGPLVNLTLGKLSKTYYELACMDLPGYALYQAQGAAKTTAPIFEIRLTKDADSYIRDSFSLLVQESDETQVKWTARKLNTKKSGENTFEISGTAKGAGRRLNVEKNAYLRDKSLDPEKKVSFTANFTCEQL